METLARLLLQVLSQYPTVTILLFSALSITVLVVDGIYVVAFRQGRDIRFWKFSIGPRPPPGPAPEPSADGTLSSARGLDKAPSKNLAPVPPQEQVFSINYLERLKYAMGAVFCVPDPAYACKVLIKADKEMAQRILKDIVDTVDEFLRLRGGRSNGGELDANYMTVYKRKLLPRDSLNGIPGEAQGAEFFLVLKPSACLPPAGEQVVFPVGEKGVALPGAPELYASRSPIEVVQDTLNYIYPTDMPTAVRDWAMDYFRRRERHVRSFASMPIHYGQQIVGILNISSSEVNVLGKNKEDERKIEHLLQPLRFVLGVIINARWGDKEKPWGKEEAA